MCGCVFVQRNHLLTLLELRFPCFSIPIQVRLLLNCFLLFIVFCLLMRRLHPQLFVQVLEKYMPRGWFGQDRDGDPVMYEFFGHADSKGITSMLLTLGLLMVLKV